MKSKISDNNIHFLTFRPMFLFPRWKDSFPDYCRKADLIHLQNSGLSAAVFSLITKRDDPIQDRPKAVLCSVENSSDRNRCSVIRIRNFNSCFFRAGMHDLSVSNIDSHMSTVADDIAGLRTAQAA